MYLIHVELRRSAQGAQVPPETAELIRSTARPEDRLEHVSVHARALPHPAVGLYLLADHLQQAEQRAASLANRAVRTHPALLGWRTGRCAVPLITPAVELGLSDDGLGGRNGPGPFPSNRNPFHRT